MTQTVAVLGTGKIGEALLSGMIRAGWRAADLLVTTRRHERAEELRARYGVRTVTNAEAAKNADILILDQSGRALLRAPHRPADPARRAPLNRGFGGGDHCLHRRPQC